MSEGLISAGIIVDAILTGWLVAYATRIIKRSAGRRIGAFAVWTTVLLWSAGCVHGVTIIAFSLALLALPSGVVVNLLTPYASGLQGLLFVAGSLAALHALDKQYRILRGTPSA